MITYTQADYDAVKVVKGRKHCDAGDYTAIDVIAHILNHLTPQ